MAISLFDMLKIGIGPSSSHTVGPMQAALRFAHALVDSQHLPEVKHIKSELFGSLGATGRGHGSGPAVLMGLEGHSPESIDPQILQPRTAEICNARQLLLLGRYPVEFQEKVDLIYHRRKSLPFHPNGMTFTACDHMERVVFTRNYYSVGGGFVVNEAAAGADRIIEDRTELPYPFKSGNELLRLCRSEHMSIAEIMMANELAWRSEEEIRDGILQLWQIMQECVQNGIQNEGLLPGGLKVKRRAACLYKSLKNTEHIDMISPKLSALDWVNLYALAVNEENAAGGRMVTAPTNGAAGIIPAVLHYYFYFCPQANDEGVIRFLLTAAAIGILFKENASISGAEVGCQGEVGSACAMAAGGLAAAAGGTPEQIENAAEIGMEHHLGMTCDPIGGLVQIPCIERNAVAAVKAINATVMALRGNGEHVVSLDKVIRTMRDTGKDMKTKYKETSRGGLAVNMIEC